MKSYSRFVSEEMPTNNAGGGRVDGIGVGPMGEPGVRKSYVVKRRTGSKKDKKKWLSS